MRVALLTDGITPYVMGGMQRHSYYVAKYLAQRGVQIDLYHANQSSYDIAKLEFFTEEEKRHITSIVIDFPDSGKMPGHYLRASYEYSCRIYESFKMRQGVDFIYVKGFSGWKLIEEKRKGLKCAPIGIKFHGMNMFQKPPSFRGWLEQLMFRPAVKFNISNSDYVFSYGGKITDIIRRLGVPEPKIIDIPTGIEKAWLIANIPAPGKVRKFLYIGRYERLKGIEELSSSLKSFPDELPFEFHFIGPIPEKLKVKKKGVIYHGPTSNPSALWPVMDTCDVLVLPSHSEGMPNVILEAMARGMAILSNDVGAVSLMVNEMNGWLLHGVSATEISKALIKALSISDEEMAKMKAHSRILVEKQFLFDTVAERIISAISERSSVRLN